MELAVSRVTKSKRWREIHEMMKSKENYKSFNLETFLNGMRPALQGWRSLRDKLQVFIIPTYLPSRHILMAFMRK
jgi:hypothetical protein